MAAREASGMCLLGAMDRLWFHQVVLSPHHAFLPFPETSETTTLPLSQSPAGSSSNDSSQMFVISEQEIPRVGSPFKDETSGHESDSEEETRGGRHHEERPTKLRILASSKARCHSSSPVSLSKAQSRKVSRRSLQRTRSLGELELEEVKGFMDLGFTFEKENLDRGLMKLVPGLQIIDGKEEDENKGVMMRPYLSEAWHIKRPDSPLLNLRIRRAYYTTTADMKRHLKCWARMVALTIQQDS